MKVIGLTGGIASGKSLVADMLRELGAAVIDADHVAREIVRPGTPAYQEIVEAFGLTILRPDGTLDRQRLGDIVFRDPAARQRLNVITHRHIREQIQEEIKRLRASSASDGIGIIDIPLLLDTAPRDAYDLDGIIVVFVPPETQVARLVARDGLTREQALQRLQAQRPLAEKVAEADWVIDNPGSIEQTRRQVEALWAALRRAG